MNTEKTVLKTEFSTDTRFELRPTPDKFERLKNKLLAIRVQQAGAKWEESMRDAANEAAAIAWTTTVPSLVFPELFEEKFAAAVTQTQRQERITRKSRELIAA
jgi:ribosomal protein L29